MDLERKKMDASRVSTETCLVKANLILSLSIAIVLLSLHPSSVPDAFVICIMLSFTGSFCWLFMGESPKLPTVRRCYFIMSTLFMASALSLLASALLLQYVWLSSPGTQKISGWFLRKIDGNIKNILPGWLISTD